MENGHVEDPGTRQGWIDRVAKDIKSIDESKNLENSEDRESWKNLIEAAKSLQDL